MAVGKITKRTVDSLQPGATTILLWDDELKGFGFKIQPSGARSYVLQYRMGGRESPTRRYSIGKHGSPWTPSTARAEAERLAILIAQGTDPGEADKQRRYEAVDLAFATYADKFVASCRGKGRGWQALVARSLKLHCQTAFKRDPRSASKRDPLFG